MARKLEDILKAKGYSDADLAGMSTLLADAKFRSALEEEFGVLEAARSKAEADVTSWAEWHQKTAIPKLEEEMQARQNAEAEAASNRARLEALQKQGLIKLEDQRQTPEDRKPVTDEFDPKKYNLLTQEDAKTFAGIQGQRMMELEDLHAEYFELFGKPLRGGPALREEAIKAGKDAFAYIREKFKFAEKHAEIAAKAAAERESEIRKDERMKVASEYANPQTRPGQVSRASFLPKAPKDDKAPMPWDNANERTQARIEKVTQKIMTQ